MKLSIYAEDCERKLFFIYKNILTYYILTYIYIIILGERKVFETRQNNRESFRDNEGEIKQSQRGKKCAVEKGR